MLDKFANDNKNANSFCSIPMAFKLAIGIKNKRNWRFIVISKLIHVLAQVPFINLRLVLENITTEILAQLL